MSAVGLLMGRRSAGQGQVEMHAQPRAQKQPRELEICPELGVCFMAPGPENTLSLCCQPRSGLLLWPHSAPAVGGDPPLPSRPDIQQSTSKTPQE